MALRNILFIFMLILLLFVILSNQFIDFAFESWEKYAKIKLTPCSFVDTDDFVLTLLNFKQDWTSTVSSKSRMFIKEKSIILFISLSFLIVLFIFYFFHCSRITWYINNFILHLVKRVIILTYFQYLLFTY